MHLKSLHLHRYSHESNLHGSIEFFTKEGEIKLELRPEHITSICSVVADSLVASAKSVAEDLTASIINNQTALPDNS